MRHRDERGQATLMIIGFAFVLALAVALVVDASAAYLQRQGLDTVADGAALRVPTDRLDLTAAAIRASVHEHLVSSGAYASYPGLRFSVDVDPAVSRVTVHVQAPLDLPLTVPGSPEVATIGATGSAVVAVEP